MTIDIALAGETFTATLDAEMAQTIWAALADALTEDGADHDQGLHAAEKAFDKAINQYGDEHGWD